MQTQDNLRTNESRMMPASILQSEKEKDAVKKHQMFLDMQEHPENYSDEQIEAMMDELDRIPDAETAWQKFVGQRPSRRWLQIAASIVGVLMVSGIAIAAIHIWSLTPNPSPKGEGNSYIQISDTIKHSTPLSNQREVEGEATVIYDNIPLEKMLPEIAAHYDAKVTFANDEARGLRFRFVWNPQQDIDQVISDLNQFERLTVTRKGNQITVDGLLSPSEK